MIIVGKSCSPLQIVGKIRDKLVKFADISLNPLHPPPLPPYSTQIA